MTAGMLTAKMVADGGGGYGGRRRAKAVRAKAGWKIEMERCAKDIGFDFFFKENERLGEI